MRNENTLFGRWQNDNRQHRKKGVVKKEKESADRKTARKANLNRFRAVFLFAENTALRIYRNSRSKIMKTYIYKFADGTKSVVEVTDELYDILTEMDKEEKYGNRSETRRHVSLESLLEKAVEPSVTDEYFSDDILGNMDNEQLQERLICLTDKQKVVIIKAVIEGMSFREIAREMGLNKDTIREQYWAAIKKLQEFS